jgi:uncharacterized protein (TIGR02594 family)
MNEAQPIAVADPPPLAYARTKRGIHEIVGHEVHPYIAHCFDLVHMTGAQDDLVAWCSAFMNGVMHDTGNHYTESAAARSWQHFDQFLVRLAKPVHGCILVFSRPPDPSHGHVTFYDAMLLGQTPDGMLPCYGGNQHNQVCDAFYPKKLLEGCYWPRGYPLPPDAVLYNPPPETSPAAA